MTDLVGIVNVTPDSFIDDTGSIFQHEIKQRVLHLIHKKISYIDIGGQSTKPNATRISADIELDRLAPAIDVIKEYVDRVQFSIDTFYPEVADYALKSGFSMVNDVTGLQDPKMIDVISNYGAKAVLMYPRSEKDKKISSMISYFSKNLELLEKKGITEVLLDPGIGFGMGKKLNTRVLRSIDRLAALDKPLFFGVSHKSFELPIAKGTNFELYGNYLDAVVYSAYKNVDYLRVHDAEKCAEAVELGRSWRGSENEFH